MILSRVIEHVKHQNWTAVALDFVIVVLGVFIGIQVSNLNEALLDRQRTNALINAFRTDLNDFNQVQEQFASRCAKGFAAFDKARARAEEPAPFFLRISGSESPPLSVWQAAIQSDLAELIPPELLFELGYFYSEQQGMSVKYIRYDAFVESRILPYLNDPGHFYDARDRLKPEYAQNMALLREWMSDNSVLQRSSQCLLKRFENPYDAGESCRPHYETFDEKMNRS
jgi:hypothetical protein